jgi:hypothetical protein
MSEHDDRYVRNNLPTNTGEFRAAPDSSASTAEFRAFAAGQQSTEQRGADGSWPEQPWAGGAPAARSGRTIAIIVGVIVVVAIVVAVVLIG